MNMKIRLVGGPFGGKVEKSPNLYGRNEIVMRGPKKMTRKEKWEWQNEQYEKNRMDSRHYPIEYPRVEARYRISRHPQSPTYHNPITGVVSAIMPCMHPDGSIFYEYVEGSKKEWS